MTHTNCIIKENLIKRLVFTTMWDELSKNKKGSEISQGSHPHLKTLGCKWAGRKSVTKTWRGTYKV